jgi:hypothetical protein
MKKKLITIVLAVAIALTSFTAYTNATEIQGEGYTNVRVEGQQILVDDDLKAFKGLRKSVLSWIKHDLKYMEKHVPDKARESVKHVGIWVNLESEPVGGLSGYGAAYFPGNWWLLMNDLEPNKGQGVEIFNALEYVNWHGFRRGLVLIHELSHAYESQILSKKERNELIAAYQRARLSGIYDKVHYGTDTSGNKYRAYALTDYHEYFAELSEAYFGDNDYFPHNRIELAVHDEVGFALMQKLWNR